MRERARLDRRTVAKLLGIAGGCLLIVALAGWLVRGAEPHSLWDVSAWLVPAVAILALVFETMDTTAGMGFGTTLAPLLLAMGYGPLTVVPALLITQSVTGLVSGVAHHELHNVRFSTHRGKNQATKLTLLIAGVGVPGIIASVVLVYLAIGLPAKAIKIGYPDSGVGFGFGLDRWSYSKNRILV